jgi:hypothetical protein
MSIEPPADWANIDRLEFPAMKGSHGIKPAVGPYRFRDPAMLRTLIDKMLVEILLPWQGDRLSEAQMRCILTTVWFTLSHLDGETMQDHARALAMVDIEDLEEVDEIPDLIATLEDVVERLRNRWNGEFPAPRK